MGGDVGARFFYTATSGRMGTSLPMMFSGERLQASGLQYARGTVGWSIGGGKGEKKVCFP